MGHAINGLHSVGKPSDLLPGGRHIEGIDLVRIRMIAGAYVIFAVRNGSRYRLMFSAELTGCEDLAFKQAGERSFDVLHETIERGVTEGALRADTNGTHALAAWSLVHGLSTLILDGKLPRPESDREMDAFTQIIPGRLV